MARVKIHENLMSFSMSSATASKLKIGATNSELSPLFGNTRRIRTIGRPGIDNTGKSARHERGDAFDRLKLPKPGRGK
jgi:hypothetical protein